MTRRRLLIGAGATVLALTGLGRSAAGDTAPAITVYKNPT